MEKKPLILTRSHKFTYRTHGLIKSGAMKIEDCPLWYEVCMAFPPKYEPRFDRPESNIKVRSIFYSEDIIRS